VNEAAKSATKAAARKSQPSEPTTRHATPRSERADGMGMMSVWCVSVKTVANATRSTLSATYHFHQEVISL
jgi:hypothetical protein